MKKSIRNQSIAEKYLSIFWVKFREEQPTFALAEPKQLADSYLFIARKMASVIKKHEQIASDEMLRSFAKKSHLSENYRPFLLFLLRFEQVGCLIPLFHVETNWYFYSAFLPEAYACENSDIFWTQYYAAVIRMEKKRLELMFKSGQVLGGFLLSVEEANKEGAFYRIKGSVYTEGLLSSLQIINNSDKESVSPFFFFFERRILASTAMGMANNQTATPKELCDAIANYPFLYSCSFRLGKSMSLFYCASPGSSANVGGSKPTRTRKTKCASAVGTNFQSFSALSSSGIPSLPAPEAINVFNVGLGNFVSIDEKGVPIALFDGGIGFRGGINHSQEKRMDDFLNNFHGLIILSHLHFDHYGMLAMATKKNYLQKLSWVVPFETGNVYSLYLVNFLNGIQQKGNLFRFDVSKCGIGTNYTLYKGTGNASDLNLSGLVLQVQNYNHFALLSGDCSYGMMNAALINCCYSFVLAAHHGENVSIPSACPTGVGQAYAVFSCRNLPSIVRPYQAHVNLLRQHGFTILISTEDIKEKIMYKFVDDSLLIE